MTHPHLSTPNALYNGRPTIAVLVGSMSSNYHEGIVRGAAYVAEKHDYNLIGFCGGVIGSNNHLTLARDKIFELVDMNLISGVISPFSSHLRFLDAQDTANFIGRFSSVPVVNIGSKVDDCTNVITDYETGLNQLFEHLYHHHGYRKIALLRGPKPHPTSNTRTAIYKNLLAQYDLPFDEDLLIYSDLRKITAKKDMADFLVKTNKPFDAIITVNDNQALGVIEACKEHGLSVPEDVAVIGSMDSLEGTFSTPALTTIEEPMFKLGKAAALELIAQIEGKPASPQIHIPTGLTIRESCGCQIATPTFTDSDQTCEKLPLSCSAHNSMLQQIDLYTHKAIKKHRGGINTTSVELLVTSLREAISTDKYNHVLSQLNSCFEFSLKTDEVLFWLDVTSNIQVSSLEYLKSIPSSRSSNLIKFISDVTTLKNKIEQSAIRYQSYETEYYLNYFRAVVNDLNTSFDLTTIKKYAIDILDLSELYISFFKEIEPSQPIQAKNIITVRNNEFIDIEQKEFLARNIIPPGVASYNDRYSLMVFPLSFASNPIGFMTVNFSTKKGTAFENLRAIISSALKNETLIQNLKSAEERFSDIAHSTSDWLWETDVENRFTYSSNSSFDIIGYSPEQLIGTSISDLCIDQSCCSVGEMNKKASLVDVEFWGRHENGRALCLLISARPIVNDGEYCGYRGIIEDITEQKLQEERIRNLAYTDTLTALPNRTMFHERLNDTIKSSQNHDKSFALMFIDLDHFKHVNDSMGHAAGDQLLVQLSKRLTSAIRSTDTLARLGGDEFIIILPDITEEQDITDIAQRIFEKLTPCIDVFGQPVQATLSLGISLYPHDGTTVEELLKKGDSAMYQAKSQGRNGYVFYNKQIEENSLLRTRNEAILRKALTVNSFILNYQPQVSLDTGSIAGFEVLVRIHDDVYGVIPPNDFIPLAEELGLIQQVDEWVFRNACQQLADWRSQGLPQTRLSINLSAQQLRSTRVLGCYQGIMNEYDIDPTLIQIEITEHALISNQQIALAVLTGFRELGVKIALDDFGTGHSSLTCISVYPIDTIKIDRSFVKDATENPRNKAIIQGTVLIAKQLGLNIVAEGVETKSQYQFIQNLSCDEIQGYYFYMPLSEKEAMKVQSA